MTGEVLKSDWETQTEIDAVLSETGVTMDQVRRWRREGLLSKEIDWSPGSAVRYPRGTCAQIVAAAALFKEKNRVDYVGFRLWCRGSPVDEKFWRPRLRQRVGCSTECFRLLMGSLRGSIVIGRRKHSSIMRLVGLNKPMTSFFPGSKAALILSGCQRFSVSSADVGTGEFEGFEAPVAGEEETTDRALTIKALDLANAGGHSILGKKLNMIELLPSGLNNVSAAISMGNFEAYRRWPGR